MSNPLEDYLGAKTKTAGFLSGASNFMRNVAGEVGSETRKSFVSGAGHALGSTAVGAGAATLGMATMRIVNAVKKRGEFKSMLEHNADLLEHHEQDPAGFNARYNSLRAMVPAYAADPIVAGSLMRNMSLNPETAGSVIMQAMESRAKSAPKPGFKLGF